MALSGGGAGNLELHRWLAGGPHVDVFATDLILAVSYPLDVSLPAVFILAATVILSLVGNI